MSQNPILVIKHGALGDIILATAAMKAIRERHPEAHITLLTTKPYAELMAQSPYFNEIWIDSKPRWYQWDAIKRLAHMLNSHPWDWVYDLQASTRTTLYVWLFRRPRPNISSANRWASHPRGNSHKPHHHALDNIRKQLAITGIANIGQPDVSWLGNHVPSADDQRIVPPVRFALLVPGGAAHRPEKRWPAEQYASLAGELVRKHITPILIGSAAEKDVLDSITVRVPQSINLGGQTNIADLATLARQALLAVGNDTGPMHVIAAAGCPSTVLFSRASDPARSAPLGPRVTILREIDLSQLSVDRVLISMPNQSA